MHGRACIRADGDGVKGDQNVVLQADLHSPAEAAHGDQVPSFTSSTRKVSSFRRLNTRT